MLTLVGLCLLGHIDASRFAGALAEEPADLSDVPVSQLTHDQLLSEQKRLEPYRTSFVGPVVMTAVGGGVLILGVVFGVVGIFYALLPTLTSMPGSLSVLAYVGYAFIALGAVAVIAGGIFLTIGLIRLFPALARRREASERRDEIQKRLEGVETPAVPPPPLPPGVDVLWRGPEPGVLLATF